MEVTVPLWLLLLLKIVSGAVLLGLTLIGVVCLWAIWRMRRIKLNW